MGVEPSPHEPPGVNPGHRQLLRVLAARTPVVQEVAVWPGDMQLEMSAYVGGAELPDELVVSVRCLVTVGARVLVCQDAAPSVHVLPGGRREPGESWQRTAQREVMEETGWHVDPARLEMLGFVHVHHTSPVPADHPFPHPDFLQVVMRGEGAGSPADWVDSEGWVQRSWLASVDEAQALPLAAISLAFLGHLNHG